MNWNSIKKWAEKNWPSVLAALQAGYAAWQESRAQVKAAKGLKGRKGPKEIR